MSLADALLTRTQQRVLGLLYGNPDRSFFATEIIQYARLGSGAVQRELERLSQSGLAVVKRVGNQKHYQANPDAPIFQELRSIILKTAGLAEPLRSALAPLARKIELALIYGSVARGEDRAGSDIDLLIVGDDLTLEDVFKRLAPVEQMLGRKISPTLYTPEEFQRRRRNANSFLQKVLGGTTIPLIGSSDVQISTR